MAHELACVRSLSFTRSIFRIVASVLVAETLSLEFGQAEQQFEKILTQDPYRIDDIDIYSNILYVTDNKLKLSRLAHEFLALDKDRPEICCLVGEKRRSWFNRMSYNRRV
jgi:hypothetical protein